MLQKKLLIEKLFETYMVVFATKRKLHFKKWFKCLRRMENSLVHRARRDGCSYSSQTSKHPSYWGL